MFNSVCLSAGVAYILRLLLPLPACCAACCSSIPQVYTCEQVLSYLKQFVAVKAASAVEMKEVEAPAPGMKLLAKKGDDDSDSLFTGMGGKKGRGARKAAEKQKAVDTVKVRCAVGRLGCSCAGGLFSWLCDCVAAHAAVGISWVQQDCVLHVLVPNVAGMLTAGMLPYRHAPV